MTSYDGALSEFWDEFSNIFPGGAGDISEVSHRIGIEEVCDMLLRSLNASLSDVLPSLFTLLGACVLTCIVRLFVYDEERGKTVELASFTVLSLMIYASVSPLVGAVTSAVSQVSSFLSALSPIAAGLLLSSGNISSAATQAMSMNAITAALSFISSEILSPLCLSIFAFATISPFSGKEATNVVKWLKNIFFALFGTVSGILLASLSIGGGLATAKDSLYLKTAKQMVGSLVPAVGGTVSASMSALLGGFEYMKSSIGALSVVLVLSIFLPVFFSLLFVRCTLSICSAFFDISSTSGGVRVFSAFIGGIDTLLCAFVLCFLSAFFCLICFMKCGVTVFG